MADMWLPREVRPIWLEGIFTSHYELTTLPLLFSDDELFNKHYDSLIINNPRIVDKLEELRTVNSKAREFRANGMWQDSIEALWKTVEMRKLLFENQDFQYTAALSHFIQTIINFATFFLKEGGNGKSPADEAMFYRSFNLFKRAEEIVGIIDDRTNRMFLKSAIANNFATYYARRKKHKEAAQHMMTSAKAFSVYTSETANQRKVTRTQEKTPNGGMNRSGSASVNEDKKVNASFNDEQNVNDENENSVNSSETLKARIEALYFAVQRGSSDIWLSYFDRGLIRLLGVLDEARDLYDEIRDAEEGEIKDNNCKYNDNNCKSEFENPVSCSSRSSSSNRSTSPKRKPNAERKPQLIDKEKQAKGKKESSCPEEEYTIRVLGCPNLPIFIATMIALYHNIGVAHVGLRNYAQAASWVKKAQENGKRGRAWKS